MDNKFGSGVIDCKIRFRNDEGKKKGRGGSWKMGSFSNKPVERMKVLVDRKEDI